MKVRVLMIGPGRGVIGGIATMINILVPVLNQHADSYFVPMTKGRLHKGDAGRLTVRNLLAVFRQYFHFLFVLTRFRPQVIHLHTSQGNAWLKDTYYILVARLFRIPLVLHVHADIERLYTNRPVWERRYTLSVLRLASAIITVSERSQVFASGQMLLSRAIMLRNCVDVQTFEPHYSPGDGSVNILFLGAIGPSKGLYDLLQAALKLKEKGFAFTMWLAGYEEKDGELERASQEIAKHGLQTYCQLLGIISGKDKEQYIRNADIFVLPSYHEGLPVSVLEAMAAGLVIVATSVGGIPDVVRNGENGFLVNPGDVITLSNCLELLIQQPELRRQIGHTNRKFAESNLDVQTYVNNLLSLYESLLNNHFPKSFESTTRPIN